MLFAFTQGTIFQFWTPDCLRGYGLGTPNGALWTIDVLVQFYIVAYFLYKFLHGKSDLCWMGGGAILFIAIGVATPLIQDRMPEIAGKLLGQTLFPFMWMFYIPCYMAEKKDKVNPFFKRYGLLFIVAAIIMKEFYQYDIKFTYGVLRTLTLFFAVLSIGYMIPQINVKTDISYGIYIYHGTILNIMATFGLYHDSYILVLVIGSSCVLAWLSTVTVGKYSKRQKTVLAVKE